MNDFKSISKVQLVAVGVMLAFAIGCHDDAASPASNGGSVGVSTLYRITDTSQCSTASAICQVGGGDLKLYVRSSEVKYRAGSVSAPTPVSFSICRLDTAGTKLRPKAAVFGPNSNLTFLKPLEVKLDLVDAGLPSNTQDNTPFRLYRKNENTGIWDFVLVGKTSSDDSENHEEEVRYEVSRNGTYAITLANRAVDTTWTNTGQIPPTGGTISLQGSSIVFPQGALTNSTQVSFTMSQATPVGLPGATNRVYNFGPDGIVFQKPVTLFVSFDDAGIEGEKIPPLRFYYFNPSTSTWVRQPTHIDWRNQQFIITLSHFSQYAFGRIDNAINY